MASIFSKIVAGEIPSHKVAENGRFLAFLDIQPLTDGHVLVIPKQETDYIFDLDDDTYTGLMRFAKQVAGGLKKAVPCNRIGVTVIGLEVPHAHVHLLPINTMGDMNFDHPRKKRSNEELADMAQKIREAVGEIAD